MENLSDIKEEDKKTAALRRQNLMEDSGNTQYDEITELAAYICGAPIAWISLLDEDRQVIKSKVGIEIYETPREYSFCNYAIANPKKILEIRDTREDSRFERNPLVNSTRPVIFYAGIPLISPSGYPVGTLSVMDFKPGSLDAKQKKAMKTLAKQVERLFELGLKNSKLLASEGELKRNNSMLKDFAGAVSHDLKMPLASIIMTIEVLKKKYADKLDSQAMDYLNRLKQSSFGMSEYISNILAYYETENISYKDVSEEPFSFLVFLEDIIDMLNVDRKCEINLPDRDFDLHCNRSALEQVFLNLLGNSLKYNDKDKIIIDISGRETANDYKFEIRDNGIGIPAEQQEKIFDLFSIAANRDRNGKKGHGIGLSTVKKIIEKLGGNIKVDSKEGEFSKFKFCIRKPELLN